MTIEVGKRWLVAAVMAGSLGTNLIAEAQPKAAATDGEIAAAESTAKLVEELGTAAQLAAFGRGEMADVTGLKGFKSPEALVAAGSIYLRAHKATGGKVQPSDAKVMEDGKAVSEEAQAPSMADDAEALFDEARALATTNGAAIEALIKQAKSVESRGAVGGPRTITRTIKTGKTHNIDLTFDVRSPASVTMRGTGTTQFEVLNSRGKVMWHSKGTWGFYNWHPGNGGGEKNVTVRVINGGGPPVSYTVTTN
jgi:hypothetical protein